MNSFSANFILSPTEGSPAKTLINQNFSCPICQLTLTRATGDNIPDNIRAYECPEHHGYFFPSGELAAFKAAQQAKIAYHKLWNLPLPSVSSVLLAGILILVLAGGLTAFQALQTNQVTTSQAQNLLANEHAYVVPDAHEVLITAQTDEDATLTVFIPSLNNFQENLTTRDNRTHMLVVQHVPAGTYSYFFSINIQGRKIPSDTFTFTMP